MRSLCLLLIWVGTARAEDAPLLRLEFETRADANEPSLVHVDARALVLIAPDGKTLWRRPPPERLASFEADKKSVAAYRRNPRAPLEAIGFPFTFTVTRPDSVVLIARDQLVVLARADGKIRYHQLVAQTGFGSLRYRHADATVECGGRRVTRHVAAGLFVIDCGSRLVYFFGQGIHAFKTAPWGTAGTVMFDDVTPAQPRYEFPFDGAKLILTPTD